MVFLVETAQQVAVMLVNYKGRPWMKGVTENPGLLYSLAGCVAGVTAAAWEIVPQLNEYLGLVPLPDDATRYTLLGLIAATLVGSLVWDRLCVLIFAPRIFKSQVDEIAALSIGDFWGPNSAKYCAAAIAGAAWLYYTEGNMLLLGMVYMLYRRTQTPARTRPARPLRCAALAELHHPSVKLASWARVSNVIRFTRPVSTTTVTSGIVTDVSAALVARTTFTL